MKPLIFLDTETCGLGVTDPIWEVAVIRRDDEGTSSRTVFQVRHNPKAALELPEWFRADHDARYVFKDALKRTEAAELLRGLLAPNSEGKAVIVGAAPDFDVTRISRQLLDDLPSGDLWDHHLIDVTTLAIGARGFGARVRRVTRIEGGDWYHEVCPPPAEEVKPGEEACPVCWLIHPRGECDR